ncbi:MAG: potassium transporter TrkG [Candidatus Omnitrophica bacterium]|nr:potassium transporter TrkG [Candidatus Omnitrophota bacterium]
MDKSRKAILLTPIRTLILGYFFITLTGALLLTLPISSANGTPQPFVDALFLATSGISTSGLTVVDISSYYSFFGQVVLMSIFQIGGVGYMTFIIFVAYLLGTRVSVRASIIAKESLATESFILGRFFKDVFLFTLIVESIGAFILTVLWMKEFPLKRSIYLGIFHSVSAFCTAGFSLFSNSFMNYRDNILLNMTVNIISIVGGIGFFVLIDVKRFFVKELKDIRPRKLTLHSKIVLLITLIVMTAGTVIIFVSEKWPVAMTFYDRLMASAFQSISASTTDGFNSIDIGSLSATSLTMLIVLMFIGASPGSTGGGMKTTTLGTLLGSVNAYLNGRESVNVFGREISWETVMKAFSVFCLFIVIALADMLILANVEKFSYIRILFEVISALGNTGLSTGITPELTFVGKIVLTITMFVGRVGPLTLSAAFIAKAKPQAFRYPTENIFIG